jgi:hypothetical protein
MALTLAGSALGKGDPAAYPIVFHGCAQSVCWDWAGMKVKQVIPSDKIASIQVLHAASLSREKKERIETMLRDFAKGEGQFSSGLHMAMANVDRWEGALLTTDGKVFLLSECGIPPALFVTSGGKSGVVPLGN